MNPNPQSRKELRELIDGYIESVLDGTRVVGKLERLAVERHLSDLEAVVSGEREDLRFHEDSAFAILDLAVKRVRHTKGQWARKPFVFNEQSAWIAFVLWCVFGWKKWDEENQGWYRRFTSAYVSIGRKNGKTMIAAIIALFLLAFDGEAGAEVYFAATKRDQAKIGWKQLHEIVKRSGDKELKRLIKARASTSHLFVEDDDSVCVALGRDKDSHDGLNPSAAIVDELHAHKDRDQWDVLESGMGARVEPLMFGITTAGARKDGLCFEMDRDAIRLLNGTNEDDSMFAFICRIDEGDSPLDYEALRKANPNLGVSVLPSYIRRRIQQAKNNPSYLYEFIRKHANCFTDAERAWLPVEKWEACAGEFEIPDGAECYVAVDASATQDYTAGVAAFPLKSGDIAIRPRLWIPEDRVEERRLKDKAPVARWVKEGWVHTTHGAVVDQNVIKQWLLDLSEKYEVHEVPIDRWETTKLRTELEDLGFKVFEHGQGFAGMNASLKEMEKLILRAANKETPRLFHDGNPAMRWMFLNVSIREDPAGLKKFDKDKSTDRIDGIVATAMAVGRAGAKKSKKYSFYGLDEEGVA